jgi:hypothetical protein
MTEATADLGVRWDFPEGPSLYYRDEDHSYWRCKEDGSRGKRLTGVTTSIKPIDFNPDRLLTWAAKMQCIGVAELAAPVLADPMLDPAALGWLNSQEAIWAALEEAELTFEHVREKAAKRGTNVHVLALQALGEGRMPDYEAMTEEERGYAGGVVEWWMDHDPQPLQVEQVVYSDTLGVAGTMDLRCNLPGGGGANGAGLPVLVDAKTSSYIAPRDHLQLAAYDYCSRECGIGGTAEQYVLHLHPDGSYQFIPGIATHDDFIAVVDIYRRAAKLDREARKAWASTKDG